MSISWNGKFIAAAQGPEQIYTLNPKQLDSYVVWAFDVESDSMTEEVTGLFNAASSVSLNSDGHLLAFRRPESLSIRSVVNHNYVFDRKFLTLDSQVRQPRLNEMVILSGDAKRVLWGHQLFDVSNGKVIRTFEDSPDDRRYAMQSYNVSLDGRFVAGGFDGGFAKVWDVESGSLVFKKQVFHNGAQVFAVALSDDGSRLLTGGADAIGGFSPNVGIGGVDPQEPYIRLWAVP